MKTYTVLYEEKASGQQQTYGPFKTFDEAYDWAKAYIEYIIEYNIMQAKLNGVEYEANEAKDNGGGIIEIDKYGTLKVLENHIIDFDASKPICEF